MAWNTATTVFALMALLGWCAATASGQCNWTSWSINECNCTDETYWSVRTCQLANGTVTYLYSMELDIANCSSQCQVARSPSCVCNTLVLGADNVTWECQDYECFLYGAGDLPWTEWTPVTDCGTTYRSHEMSCNWTSASTASKNALSSPICGERCIACITQPQPAAATMNCVAICGNCTNDTTFSISTQNCSSMYSIEIENVTCGSWTAWLEPSRCRAPTACPSCPATQTRRRRCSITGDEMNADGRPCNNVVTSDSSENTCYINASSSTFQVVAPADPKELPKVLPPVEERQVSKPKLEAKQAVAVGGSMCLVFVGFIIFIVVIDAQSLAGEAVNRMGKNLRMACKRKKSPKLH